MQRMNHIRACAKEIVEKEIIFTNYIYISRKAAGRNLCRKFFEKGLACDVT